MSSMVNLEMLEKCGILGKVSIAWASWRSKTNLWAKLVSNVLKYVMGDVHKVCLAVVKDFVTGHV